MRQLLRAVSLAVAIAFLGIATWVAAADNKAPAPSDAADAGTPAKERRYFPSSKLGAMPRPRPALGDAGAAAPQPNVSPEYFPASKSAGDMFGGPREAPPQNPPPAPKRQPTPQQAGPKR